MSDQGRSERAKALLRDEVHDSLEAAVENGFKQFVMGEAVERVVADLRECGSVSDYVGTEELVEIILEWRKKYEQ